jgi:putative ABC transport system permease protein
MIRNYFKSAWRNVLKNKTFSAINIVGLAIGMAAFLLIVNYLRFQYSFDKFNIRANRIYRVPMIVTETSGKPQTFDQMLVDIDLIKQEFKSNADVISVSRCVRSPVEGGGG